MKKEWMIPWVEKLRSDEYEQGKKRLRSVNNKFCCLGVLCDLVAKSNTNSRWEEFDGQVYFEYDGELLCDVLPHSVMKLTGMQSNDGFYYVNKEENEFNTLTILNDNDTYSFKDIADVIEQRWEQL